MQLFLVGMQVMSIGLNFVFWAMLPNTIEYGERETGLHVEGTVFGVAALLQRIAIGIATAILGWSFASAGYVANVQQSAATLGAMRQTVALVPLVFLALVVRRDGAEPARAARAARRAGGGLGAQLEAAVDAVSSRLRARSRHRTCPARLHGLSLRRRRRGRWRAA